MIQGNFFRLDEENSILSEGLVIFRYLPIISEEGKNPVYLEINKHYISFNYHTYGKDNTNNISHINIELFRLPLSINLSVKDNLTAILKYSYNTFYPLVGSDNYINKAIEFNENDKKISYWNLNVFFDKDQINDEFKKNGYRKLSRVISFRKLILDFLYDFEHHQVFKNSPFYDDVEVKLKENFFFSALAAKSAYYYHRELYMFDKDIYNDSSFSSSMYNSVIKDINETETQWLNIVRKPVSCSLFQNSNDWFQKVEDEYKNVFFKSNDGFKHSKWQKELAKIQPEVEKDYIALIKETGVWFLRRYDIISAVKTIINYKQKLHFLFYFLLFISLIVFPLILKKHYQMPNSDLSIDHTFQYVAFITYSLIGLTLFLFFFTIIFWKLIIVTINVIMPRMIMAIISAWFVFATTEELVKTSFDASIIKKEALIIFLLIPIVIFMVLELRKLAPDISKNKMLGRVSIILIVAFIYSILTGIFMTNFIMKNILIRSSYLETYYVNIWKTDIRCKYLNGNETKIDSLELEKKTNFKNNKEGNKLSLIVYALSDTSKLSKQEKGYFEDKKRREKQIETNNYIFPDTLFKYLSYVRTIPKKNCKILYEVPLGKEKILIFPHMLLFRAIFALFMGIFIQLIFEEKAVTEPI